MVEASAQDGRQLRWGLLSTARINDRIIDALARSDRSTLVAVASRTAEGAAAYAATHGIEVSYGSYEGLAHSPDIDAVYVSVPNHLHAEWAIRLAEAGKHVLCEKPLALTVRQVDEMTEAARRAGVILQEASATRFHQQTRDIAEILASGRLGRILHGQASFEFSLPATSDIRLEVDLGGGAMWDVGCYPISFFQAVLGENPQVVFGQATWGPTGVDLAFSGQLEYPSGVKVQFTASMTTPVLRWARIVGERGSLELDQPWLTDLGGLTLVRQRLMRDVAGAGTFGDAPDQLAESQWDYGLSDVYFDEVRGFEHVVLDNLPSPYPLQDSRMNIAVIEALYESARTGKPVRLDPA